jgi:folate-binding protein YgfZ
MTALTCPPDHYVALVADGRDAASFLQGQLTQDVLQPGAEPVSIGALLTPQGRVLATAWIHCEGERRTLLLPAALGPAILEHLRRFVMRAKVTLALEAPAASLIALLEATVRARPGGEPAASWPLALVRAGLAEVTPATSGEWIPQMLNLDLVGGISFRKGCYTGQEIVARTRHLGRIKRRMRRLRVEGDAPPPGTTLAIDGAKVGDVVFAATDGGATELLAVIGLDAPPGAPALPDGRACRPLPMPYPVE